MTNRSENKTYSSWDELYKHSNISNLPWVSENIHPILKEQIDALPIKKGNALDVGCGLGQVSRYLAEQGFNTTAIDVSEKAISICKELNNTVKHIEYLVANSITFNSDKKFDLIIDFLHIHDIERDNIKLYLNNIENQLNKGGYLIFSTFTQNDKSNTQNNVRRSFYVNQEINYYTKDDIINLLNNKYTIISYQYLITGNKKENYESYLLILKHSYE